MSKIKQQQEKEFILPHENQNCVHVMNYLKKRGIDDDILNYCIDTALLYESYPPILAAADGMITSSKERVEFYV